MVCCCWSTRKIKRDCGTACFDFFVDANYDRWFVLVRDRSSHISFVEKRARMSCIVSRQTKHLGGLAFRFLSRTFKNQSWNRQMTHVSTCVMIVTDQSRRKFPVLDIHDTIHLTTTKKTKILLDTDALSPHKDHGDVALLQERF